MLMKWIKALRVYFNPRMLTMVGLGFSSGFPLLLVFSTLNLWLKDEGIPILPSDFFLSSNFLTVSNGCGRRCSTG